MVTDFKDMQNKIADISGSWMKDLYIDGKKYWDVNDHFPDRYKAQKVALPSDCRFREDMIWLRRRNEKIADAWKVRLEI